MRIIDISREVMSAPVYPGDPSPRLEPICRIQLGDICNTSALHMCVHNGTHMDAPRHFINGAPDIADITLDACVGPCLVVQWDGVLLGDQAEDIVKQLDYFKPEHSPTGYSEETYTRLLIRGTADISPSAAFVLSGAGLKLLGVEAQSVTCEKIYDVHNQLLGSGMVLLEGLDLSSAAAGRYFLFAAPLKISGSDGAPVRAVLIEYTNSNKKAV